MRSAYDIEKNFLAMAAGHGDTIQKFYQIALELDGDTHKTTRTRLYAALQEYLLARRVEMLGGMDLTPKKIDEVNPNKQTMMALNAICGFYSADRVVIHLYLNAHLVNYTNGTSELMFPLDRLVTELYVG